MNRYKLRCFEHGNLRAHMHICNEISNEEQSQYDQSNKKVWVYHAKTQNMCSNRYRCAS